MAEAQLRHVQASQESPPYGRLRFMTATAKRTCYCLPACRLNLHPPPHSQLASPTCLIHGDSRIKPSTKTLTRRWRKLLTMTTLIVFSTPCQCFKLRARDRRSKIEIDATGSINPRFQCKRAISSTAVVTSSAVTCLRWPPSSGSWKLRST